MDEKKHTILRNI